ncbi:MULTISPECIES: LCP family protein [Actinoplanes]|uniref:LCP family protein n=1 Tax=Actinoplanes TaxID=1865 RepID=UPI000AA01CFC|nr:MULTISPECIES: LCP family protein [Actinoplanes]
MREVVPRGESHVSETTKHRFPLWIVFYLITGLLLMLASGGALAAEQAVYARIGSVQDDTLFVEVPAKGPEEPESDIEGPLNILMVGIDPRNATEAPRSDSILVAHIPAGLDQAYIFSIPRDLYVQIPASEKAELSAHHGKINGSMSLGSRVPGSDLPDTNQGFQHLVKTLGQVTGIKKFDAGAIIDFGGFKDIVEAMGGVTMTVDQEVPSEHLKPDGKPRDRLSHCADNTCDHPYYGEQKVYKIGTYHLQAWEALDYVRQRYHLPNGDYDRQRHQQQFIRAIAEQALSKDMVTNPSKLLRVMDAAGKSLTFSGGGHDVTEWAVALRHLRTQNMVTVALPGHGVSVNGSYAGEEFEPEVADFFTAVRTNTVPQFLLDHPEFVNTGG